MSSTRAASALLFIGLVCFRVASAAEYYVAPSGDDNDAGTSASAAWRTVEKANQTLRPGDVVYLRGGRYVDDPIRPARSGTAGDRISYVAFEDETPVLTSDSVDGLGVAIDLTDRSYITVDGIHVDGVEPSPKARVKHFANLYRSNYNTIKNCTFRHATGWHGIRITYEAHHNQLLNNVIDVVGIYDDGNGEDFGDAVQILRGSHHNLLRGNVISRAAHNLLQVDGYNNVITGNTFENDWTELRGPGTGGRNLSLMGRQNVFENNIVRKAGRSSDTPSNAGKKTEGEGNIVRRNYIYSNSREGIISQSRESQKVARDNHIFHNTIYGNGGAAWGLTFYNGGDGVTGNVFKNNIVYSNRRDSSNGAADFTFKLSKNPTGAIGRSLIEGNLIAKDRTDDAAIDIDGDVMALRDAERAYDAFIKHNIQDKPTFVSSAPSKPEDFALAAGSRGIDEGVELTVTRSSGSGTTVPVEDAGFFSDGFGIVPGDRVRVGLGPAIEVVDVDYASDTLTLATPAEWSKAATVSLDYHGAAPDIGAFETGVTPQQPRRPRAPGKVSGRAL